MANYKHTRTQTDKFVIKGQLSPDGKFITYEDKEQGDVTVDITKCLAEFGGEEVIFNLAMKEETDLDE